MEMDQAIIIFHLNFGNNLELVSLLLALSL